MKIILTIALAFVASISIGQTSSVAIENMEENILFRGYQNKIKITSHTEEDCAYRLSGTNVSITVKDGYFIVKPGQGKTVDLTVTEKCMDGNATVVRKKEYRVKNLPTPTLHWGWTPAGKAVENQKPELSCSYVDYFQLDVKFTVDSWEAEYNGKTYSGEGTDISPINELIQTFTELEELTITASIQGPDGITRKIDGTWFIRPANN
ncbi:MAG: hypothetical protein NXI10_10300 [bacterium]|nr:hypothetical protein [bacterium]